jgi:hypothetical protein
MRTMSCDPTRRLADPSVFREFQRNSLRVFSRRLAPGSSRESPWDSPKVCCEGRALLISLTVRRLANPSTALTRTFIYCRCCTLSVLGAGLDSPCFYLVVPTEASFQPTRLARRRRGPTLAVRIPNTGGVTQVSPAREGWEPNPKFFPFGLPSRDRSEPDQAPPPNSSRRQSNDSHKNQNHANTNPQNDHRRNPKTKRMCTTIVPAWRTTLVISLPANQTKPRPPYRHNSQQQEWHQPAPLNASPTYNVPPHLTRKCFPPVANHSTPARIFYFSPRRERPQYRFQPDLSFSRTSLSGFKLDPSFIEAIEHLNARLRVLHAL